VAAGAVEAHGGTIGVEPGVPKGSVFSFEIPQWPDASRKSHPSGVLPDWRT